MKKFLLGLALVGLGVTCKSTADVNAPATEPCAADCKMECCAEPAECTEAMKAECQSKCAGETQVCPVTGKAIN
jgi:hypothetical protein